MRVWWVGKKQEQRNKASCCGCLLTASNDLTRGGCEAGVHAATLHLPSCLPFSRATEVSVYAPLKVSFVRRRGRGVVGREGEGRQQGTGPHQRGKRAKAG